MPGTTPSDYDRLDELENTADRIEENIGEMREMLAAERERREKADRFDAHVDLTVDDLLGKIRERLDRLERLIELHVDPEPGE